MDRRLALVLLLAAPAAAFADALTLDNGVRLEGIVVEETDQDVTLQVSADGLATLDRATILVIERASPRSDAKLRARWAADDRAERRREEAERDFAQRQRAKGRVEFDGEWLTKDEVEFRLRRQKLALEAADAARPPVTVAVFVSAPAAADSGLTRFTGPLDAVLAPPFAPSRGRVCRERRGPALLDADRASRFNPVAPLGGIPPQWRFRSSEANRRFFGPNSGAQ